MKPPRTSLPYRLRNRAWLPNSLASGAAGLAWRNPGRCIGDSLTPLPTAAAKNGDIVPDDADELLTRRVASYNVWKPLYGRVEELPLAMIDAQSQVDADLLRMDLKYRERTGEIYVMRHSPEHRWYYVPMMEAHQALLLKTYDSETDGRARFMGHSAFEDPTTQPGAPKRESIEVRTMAFF